MAHSEFWRIVRRAAWARMTGGEAERREWRRRMAFLLLEGDADSLSFRRDAVTWTVPVSQDAVTRNLYVHGRYQDRDVERVLAWVRTRPVLQERTWFVDLGANVGTPSIQLARAAPERRILAVEPAPRNFECLCANVQANGLAERVFPVRAAVAAAPGKLVLCLHPQLGRCEIAESGGVQGFGPAADLPRVEVPACSLASLLAERQVAPEEVGLVWSDTQGYEREVIAGGEALWRVGAPLFLELWPRGLGAHGGVAAFLAAAGRCFRGFVSEEDLARTPFPAPRPIGELAARLGALEGNAHTDALLVPERAEAV